jgi:hypothetical protein
MDFQDSEKIPAVGNEARESKLPAAARREMPSGPFVGYHEAVRSKLPWRPFEQIGREPSNTSRGLSWSFSPRTHPAPVKTFVSPGAK